MRILTTTGVEVVDVNEPGTASVVGGYWNAVRAFLGTGDESTLAPYTGVAIEGSVLETDPDGIEAFDAEGQLDFREIYER